MNGTDANIADTTALLRRIQKLEKINAALMNRVERSLDQQANAYSMFQTAIGLESQVRVRTEELKSALTNLESANEELTSARDAAERANSVKTRFFTAVSHDVLQPLHAAQLSLSALIDGANSDDQRRLAMQVDHALASIEELLRTMLDISKLEAGVIRPKMEAIALEPLFQSLVLDMLPVVNQKRLIITSRSKDLAVRSDPLMLRRILQNLLANALHYTRRGSILLAAAAAAATSAWRSGTRGPAFPKPNATESLRSSSAARPPWTRTAAVLAWVCRSSPAWRRPSNTRSQCVRVSAMAPALPSRHPKRLRQR